MYLKKMEEDLDCGIVVSMKIFGGKWKCCILDAIRNGISRPGEIAKYITEASPRVVEIQLAELLFFGVIEKCTSGAYPKKTEYKLTGFGESILPVLNEIEKWGLRHAAVVKERIAGSQKNADGKELACR